MTSHPLVATTERVGRIDDLDLVTEIEGVADGFLHQSDRGGIAATGVAARIDLPGGLAHPSTPDVVATALGRIEARDGARPVAVGVFAFDPAAPAQLVVPARTVQVDTTGEVRVTHIGPAGGPVERWRPQPPRPPHEEPDGFELHAEPGHRAFQESLEEALKAIADGNLAKVVLARAVRVEANRFIDRSVVARRLRSLYPSCATFAAGGFVGASPELLVARDGDRVRSHPLAGTVPRSGDPERDRLLEAGMLASAKERSEHSLTVDAVAAALSPFCPDLDVPSSPSIVELRNVSHLGTAIEGSLGTEQRGTTALALAAALHPTPAVGGAPTGPALAFLREHERLDRGPYAGAVGWVDASGDGEWTVGIRSAVLSGSTARLYAGVGIVEGSDPDAELAETQFKLQALLSAVVRP